MSISIVIPTLNGLSLLQKHLPALLAADGVGNAEIIVVNDGGTDDTPLWLARYAPAVRVISLAQNGGFSRACNAGIRASCGEIVVLLNNDVEVTSGFLAPLVRPLQNDAGIFAVNAAILIPGKEMLDEGQKHGAFHHGLFYVDCIHDPAQRSLCTATTLYATACAAAYRRTMLEELAGFDEAFSPAYWEDVDLSYRAWKRGWRVLYEPLSVVYHEHESTTAGLNPRFVATLRARNQFFFVWKNIGDKRFLWANLLLAPWVGVYQALHRKDRALLRGLGAAGCALPRVLAARRREQAAARVPDRAILAETALSARYGEGHSPPPKLGTERRQVSDPVSDERRDA